MRTTIKELMQLKNEVAATIKKLGDPHVYAFRAESHIEYGITTIDDRRATTAHDRTPFPDYLVRLTNLLDVSNTLNTALAAANQKHNVSEMVRERENAKALMRACEAALQHGKEYTTEESVNIAGGGVQRVTKTYTPHMTSGDLKGRIRTIKQHIRTLQSAIDAANGEDVAIDGLEREYVEALLDA